MSKKVHLQSGYCLCWVDTSHNGGPIPEHYVNLKTRLLNSDLKNVANVRLLIIDSSSRTL